MSGNTCRAPEPFRLCPRFESCSVGNCPLHVGYPQMSRLATDTETTCTARRSTRTRIAAGHEGVLRFGGLTCREYKRKLRRESRSAEEIEQARARMARLRERKQALESSELEPAVGGDS